MEAAPTVISAHILEETLLSIIENRLRIHIRFRTLGQLWYPNFLQVLKMEDGKRILFHDERRKFFISLRDLSAITAFELDANLEPLQAHCPYQLVHDIFTTTTIAHAPTANPLLP